MSPSLFSARSAEFSPCRAYRYWLEIRWAPGKALNFLLLNCSTADENVNDPTVERCERRARAWDYPAVIITNLFAFRATDPAVMKRSVDPVGPDNDAYIVKAYAFSAMTIAGWGGHGKHMGRAKFVRDILLAGAPLQCLRQTGGEPHHPLYIPYNEGPRPLKGVL